MWKGSSSLSVFATRNLGHATRISGTRGEFRAREANLGHFRCSSDRQIRIVYIFKNIPNSNLAVARTSEMSEKYPSRVLRWPKYRGVLKSKIYIIYIYLDEGSKKGKVFRGKRERKCGKVRHHSVSLQRESRARDANLGHAGRISSTWGESRHISARKAHLGAHLGVLDRQ